METLAHIQDKAERIESMFGVGDPHIIARHIKSFMPRSKGRAGYIANGDGSPAIDMCQHKQNFKQYMSVLMCAESKTYRQ
eukprot:2312010-Karenia_brevis.AAC.1